MRQQLNCLSRSVPEIHSHVAGTLSNQQAPYIPPLLSPAPSLHLRSTLPLPFNLSSPPTISSLSLHPPSTSSLNTPFPTPTLSSHPTSSLPSSTTLPVHLKLTFTTSSPSLFTLPLPLTPHSPPHVFSFHLHPPSPSTNIRLW